MVRFISHGAIIHLRNAEIVALAARCLGIGFGHPLVQFGVLWPLGSQRQERIVSDQSCPFRRG